MGRTRGEYWAVRLGRFLVPAAVVLGIFALFGWNIGGAWWGVGFGLAAYLWDTYRDDPFKDQVGHARADEAPPSRR